MYRADWEVWPGKLDWCFTPIAVVEQSWFCKAIPFGHIASNRFSSVATAIVWKPLDDWAQKFSSRTIQKQRPTTKNRIRRSLRFRAKHFGERNWLTAAQSCDQWLAAVSICNVLWNMRTGKKKKKILYRTIVSDFDGRKWKWKLNESPHPGAG